MWHHVIKDNFLPQDRFDKLLNEVKDIKPDGEHYENYGLKDQVWRKWLDYDPTPEIADVINEFSERRHYGPYKKFIHFAVTPANYMHTEHDEAEFKIMSAIIYLSPEKNIGTKLVDYRENPTERITVDWKPNRMMAFCGLPNITWHNYESNDIRCTYNYFLINPDKMQNEEFKKHIID